MIRTLPCATQFSPGISAFGCPPMPTPGPGGVYFSLGLPRPGSTGLLDVSSKHGIFKGPPDEDIVTPYVSNHSFCTHLPAVSDVPSARLSKLMITSMHDLVGDGIGCEGAWRVGAVVGVKPGGPTKFGLDDAKKQKRVKFMIPRKQKGDTDVARRHSFSFLWKHSPWCFRNVAKCQAGDGSETCKSNLHLFHILSVDCNSLD